MSFIITVIDPVTSRQSKYTDDEGKLRYDADKSLVFPGPTGVRQNGSFIKSVDTLSEASIIAQNAVVKRMDAFSEDREALENYKFIEAENKALDMTEQGCKIILEDGWTIEVTNTEEV